LPHAVSVGDVHSFSFLNKGWLRMKSLQALVVSLLLIPSMVWAAESSTWALKPIDGNNTKQWAAGSWTWDMGNPCTDNGATWSVAYQNKPNAAPTDTYLPMTKGTYVGFVRIWQGGEEASKDPQMQYKGNNLITRPATRTAQRSESVAVIFKPQLAGKYKVQIKATLAGVQNPSAGHARMGLYQISSDGRIAQTLEESDLNVKKSGAYGKDLPDTCAFEKVLDFEADQELILRLQAVNPGNASVGSCRLQIDTFEVTAIK
jgi:hypothetical protein